MKPDEVPDDLVALLRNGHHIPGPGSSAEDWARCILANTLPEHERQIRERIAARIEAVVVVAHRHQGPVSAKAEAYATAAKIARGER